jgi:predicted nucleotidyltransferase
MTLQIQIQDFTRQIAERYSPQEIILFGSYARGEANNSSDVDLLVILDHDTDNVEKAIEIRNLLHPRFALDLLVRRPDDIARRIAMNDFFIQDIVNEGVVLYDGRRSRVA